MAEKYNGVIIEESLDDNRVINNLEIVRVKVSSELKPGDRWHLYTVLVSEKDIEELSRSLKQGWYMHFWKDKKVIAIFKDKRFEFDYNKKDTWEPAIEYGLSIGIPREQLDFPIN